MRLATYVDVDADDERVGLVSADGTTVWDLTALCWELELGGPGLTDLIAAWDRAGQLVEPIGDGVPVERVRLLAPLPRPVRNLFCVGKNYRDHVGEVAAAGRGSAGVPEAPIFFTKAPQTVIGPASPIPSHAGLVSELDYEAELGVIIGRRGRAIAAADAWDHVWGYTAINDVTARDLQARHRQWFLGKSLDGFCPMGPWAVTADELTAVRAGTEGTTGPALECRVNGETRQSVTTDQMIFPIPQLVEALSAGITLEPGDVIATGTPAGVGAGFDPPRFLVPDDIVEVEIEGLGTLVNRVAGA